MVKRCHEVIRMKLLKRLSISFIVLILVIGGFFFYQYGDMLGINLWTPSPQKYAKQAVLFMDNQGIYSHNEDTWLPVKQKVLEKSKSCKTIKETHPLLEKALKAVGGKHSKLIPAEEVNNTLIANMPSVELLENDILYIKLPDFSGDQKECENYTNTVLDFTRKHKDTMAGVIIDLQHNTGGDMGPMVAAVSPFLEDGEVLSFDVHGMRQAVTIDNGTITGGGSTVTVNNPFKVTGIPVAILQDELTASSGEATLLTFRGLDYIRTFGKDSAGYCSCNNTRKLYDGSIILLTIGYDVARTDEYFCEDPIQPDEYTEDALESAKQWILE